MAVTAFLSDEARDWLDMFSWREDAPAGTWRRVKLRKRYVMSTSVIVGMPKEDFLFSCKYPELTWPEAPEV